MRAVDRFRIRPLAALPLLLLAVSTARAATVALGDLNIPTDRVPDYYPFDETVYNDARTWTEFDVTCSDAPCSSLKRPFTDNPNLARCDRVQESNFGGMNCMIAAAPDESVLFIPAGTYQINKGQALVFARSNVVVRGAGPDRTVLVRASTGRDAANRGDCGSEAGGWGASICGLQWNGPSVSWTGGFSRDTTLVRLSDVSPFNVGDWILLRMSGSTSCEYMDRTLNSGDPADGFVHIAKITAVDSSNSTVEIDRGLRMNYSGQGCTGHEAKLFRPVEHVGIEHLRVTSSGSIPVCSDGSSCIRHRPVTFMGAAASWLVDTEIDRSWDQWVGTYYSARLWIQGNDFANLDESISFNTEGMLGKEGSVDIVWENNSCRGARVCQKLDNGPEGNVTAYNYMRQSQSLCERAYFVHGHYGRENLVEGNDVDCELLLGDKWWGRNGPRNTAYRNRNVSNVCAENRDSITLNEDGGGDFPAASYVNIIGNTSAQYLASPVQNNPQCPPSYNGSNDLSTLSPYLWLENNAWRLPGGTFDHGTANERSCGTGPNDSCPGTNHNVDHPDPAWSGSYPTSFYRTQAPSWWCQEACPWSAAGIGAFGDDFSSPLCKLPAQIRLEGGSCTPLSVSAPASPSVPSAPILLP